MLLRQRIGLCLLCASVIIAANSLKRPQGIFGGFLRKSRRLVLGMSAYAYQEGCFVS